MTTMLEPLVRKAPRWMAIALIVSVGLNLLAIGTLASAVWRFRHEATFAAGPGSGNLLGFTATLSAERRDAIFRLTGDERRSLHPLRSEVRAARLDARQAFLADPFDRNVFAQAQARVLDAELRARRQTQALFVAIASQLSKEERQSFVRWQPQLGPADHWKGTGGIWKNRGRGPEVEQTPARPLEPTSSVPPR